MRAAHLVACVVVLALVATVTPASATFPFSAGGDADDYSRLHIDDGACTPLAPGESSRPRATCPRASTAGTSGS